jgi:hypothetical protein
MNMTQQEFAVQVLDSAITTVSRYESGNPPPRGDALLRFRNIARQQGDTARQQGDIARELVFKRLANDFQSIWLEEVYRAAGDDIRTFLYEPGQPVRGLLVASLKGADALAAAESFLHILHQLDSDNPVFHQNAVSAISSLQAADRRFDSPGTHDIRDAFRAITAGPLEISEKKKIGRPKRRKELDPGKGNIAK